MQQAIAPTGEVVEFALGHRTRGRHYLAQPVALVRPERGSARVAARCLGCGQLVTIALEGRAGAGWRALFWRWNFAFAIILNLLIGLGALIGAVALPALLAGATDDPSAAAAVVFPAAFLGLLCLVGLGGALLAITRLVGMSAHPRIVDDGDRQASAALLGNFMLDQAHHLLTRDGSRRLPTEQLRGPWGWFTSLRVDSAAPYPPMPMAPIPGPIDPAAWGGALGRAHAAEAIRTGVFLRGDGLAAFARQAAQAVAASLRIADPAFVARYADAYSVAYAEDMAGHHQG